MNWLPLALLIACCLGLYQFFIKVSSGNIHEVAGAVILQGVAALLGSLLLLFFKLNGQALPVTPKGIWQAVAAGICVGLAEILTFVLFQKGVPVAAGTPLIIGGSLLVAVVLGWLFLKEALGSWQILGIFLILCGVILVSLQKK